MIDCQDLDALKGEKKLRAYMLHYLSMMMAVSDIFLLLDGSAEAKEKQKGLWQYLREHTSAAVYRSIRFGFGGVTNLPFPKGDASWWAATASHGRSSSSTKFTIVAYNRAAACAAACFFAFFGHLLRNLQFCRLKRCCFLESGIV
mgnify:FL=1